MSFRNYNYTLTTGTTVLTTSTQTGLLLHAVYFTNKTTSAANLTVSITSSGTTTQLISNASVAASQSIQLPKAINLNNGDYITATSSAVAIDAHISYLDNTTKTATHGYTSLGTWTTATSYSANDVVTYLGAPFLALRPNKNDAPPGYSWRQLFSPIIPSIYTGGSTAGTVIIGAGISIDGSGAISAVSGAGGAPGEIKFGLTAPSSGWLNCDGSTIQISTYPTLAATIPSPPDGITNSRYVSLLGPPDYMSNWSIGVSSFVFNHLLAGQSAFTAALKSDLSAIISNADGGGGGTNSIGDYTKFYNYIQNKDPQYFTMLFYSSSPGDPNQTYQYASAWATGSSTDYMYSGLGTSYESNFPNNSSDGHLSGWEASNTFYTERNYVFPSTMGGYLYESVNSRKAVVQMWGNPNFGSVTVRSVAQNNWWSSFFNLIYAPANFTFTPNTSATQNRAYGYFDSGQSGSSSRWVQSTNQGCFQLMGSTNAISGVNDQGVGMFNTAGTFSAFTWNMTTWTSLGCGACYPIVAATQMFEDDIQSNNPSAAPFWFAGMNNTMTSDGMHYHLVWDTTNQKAVLVTSDETGLWVKATLPLPADFSSGIDPLAQYNSYRMVVLSYTMDYNGSTYALAITAMPNNWFASNGPSLANGYKIAGTSHKTYYFTSTNRTSWTYVSAVDNGYLNGAATPNGVLSNGSYNNMPARFLNYGYNPLTDTSTGNHPYVLGGLNFDTYESYAFNDLLMGQCQPHGYAKGINTLASHGDGYWYRTDGWSVYRSTNLTTWTEFFNCTTTFSFKNFNTYAVKGGYSPWLELNRGNSCLLVRSLLTPYGTNLNGVLIYNGSYYNNQSIAALTESQVGTTLPWIGGTAGPNTGGLTATYYSWDAPGIYIELGFGQKAGTSGGGGYKRGILFIPIYTYDLATQRRLPDFSSYSGILTYIKT